jgi:hypothetical protein
MSGTICWSIYQTKDDINLTGFSLAGIATRRIEIGQIGEATLRRGD